MEKSKGSEDVINELNMMLTQFKFLVDIISKPKQVKYKSNADTKSGSKKASS